MKYCQSRLEALQSVGYTFLAPITMEERSIAKELIRLNHAHVESRTVEMVDQVKCRLNSNKAAH